MKTAGDWYDEGYEDGAAAAFGLVGMAEAIRARPHPRKREYWTRESDGRVMYTGWCSRCGEWLKNRHAEEDDVSPYDWCGQCYWESETWG